MADTTFKITTLDQLKTALIAARTYINTQIDNLGSLAGKSQVGYNDFDDTVKAIIDGKADGSVVTTLVGEDSGKSVRAISAEEVAKVVAGADASYDTLKEIADWILSDTTGAAKMAADISRLDAILDGIGGEGELATVVAYVTDMINSVGIGGYVTTEMYNAGMAGKVDKVDGSRLMTNAEGTKLGSISESANKTESSEVNGNVKIDGIETPVYTHPTATAAAAALVKVGNDAQGHVVLGDAVAKADIVALGIPAQDTTYSAATAAADGLMSSTDKSKLDGLVMATNDEVTAACNTIFGVTTA